MLLQSKKELKAIHLRYIRHASHLPFQPTTGEGECLVILDEFNEIVACENFLGELDYLVWRVQVELGLSDHHQREGAGLLSQYTRHDIDCVAKTIKHAIATFRGKYNICLHCCIEMSVNADTSELTCAECGKVQVLIGTVLDEAQLYFQKGQNVKLGLFNPNHHFQFWMDRILAREPQEEQGDKDDPGNTYGEKLLEQLREIIRRDEKKHRLLTVDDIRAMLKEIGRMVLNKNSPLIM